MSVPCSTASTSSAIPASASYKPMDFQEESIRRMVDSALQTTAYGCLCADEMGLGKSSQMVEAMRRLLERIAHSMTLATTTGPASSGSKVTTKPVDPMDELKFLIIAPKSILPVWKSEATMVSPALSERVVICDGKLDKFLDSLKSASVLPYVVITTPGLIRRYGWPYVNYLRESSKSPDEKKRNSDRKRKRTESSTDKKSSKRRKSASLGSQSDGKSKKGKDEKEEKEGKDDKDGKDDDVSPIPWFYAKEWWGVVVDEAHDILANGVRMTARGKFVEDWSTKTPHCIFQLKYKCAWALTGTPIRNSLSDLVSLARFILARTGHVLADLASWSMNSQQRKLSFARQFLIRHTDQVLNLPPLERHIIKCPMSDLQRENAKQDFHTTFNLLRKLQHAKGIARAKIHMAILAMISRMRLNNSSPYLLKNAQTQATVDQATADEDGKSKLRKRKKKRTTKAEDDVDYYEETLGEDSLEIKESKESSQSESQSESKSSLGSGSPASPKKPGNSASRSSVMPPVWETMDPAKLLEDSPKIKRALALLDELLQTPEQPQILVFSFSVRTLHMLAHLLTSSPAACAVRKQKATDGKNTSSSLEEDKKASAAPILDSPPPLFTGETTAEDRETMVRLFQAGEERVLLLSSKAGGMGITLTAATHVFLLDPWWHPFVEFQSEKRAHRKGQTKTCHVHRFYVDEEESIDNWMLGLQKEKLQEAKSVIPDFDRYTDCFVANGNHLNLVENFARWVERWCRKYQEKTPAMLRMEQLANQKMRVRVPPPNPDSNGSEAGESGLPFPPRSPSVPSNATRMPMPRDHPAPASFAPPAGPPFPTATSMPRPRGGAVPSPLPLPFRAQQTPPPPSSREFGRGQRLGSAASPGAVHLSGYGDVRGHPTWYSRPSWTPPSAAMGASAHSSYSSYSQHVPATWSCGRCTLDNEWSAPKCQLCEFPRDASVVY